MQSILDPRSLDLHRHLTVALHLTRDHERDTADFVISFFVLTLTSIPRPAGRSGTLIRPLLSTGSCGTVLTSDLLLGSFLSLGNLTRL